MSPLSADVPPATSSVTSPSNSQAVAVSACPTSPNPPAVSAFSSVAYPSFSSPLHSALSSALFSWTLPTMRYFTLAPSLLFLTGGSSVAPFLPLSDATIVAVATVFLLATPALLRVSHLPPLFLFPALLPPPPPPLGILCPPDPSRAPPPPAPAANIARRGRRCWQSDGQG